MKKIFISIAVLSIIVLYSFNVYNINKKARNLRDYKEEQINSVFNAYEGEILVKSIKLINNQELIKINNINEYNRKYIDTNNNEYLDVVYVVKGISNEDCLEIKANTDGYIFYDGLPSPNKISKNEYEYLIPLPKEKLGKYKGKKIKIFFDNIKVNELEHHYINFNL
ncbi:hypothetical protein [Peptostreptococcus stomatis]